MERLPSLELLENTHSFPGFYTFKVIGKVDKGFLARVITQVRDALELDEDPPFTFRQTQNGKHMAITLEPRVISAQQVLNVYHRVQGMEGLVMLM